MLKSLKPRILIDLDGVLNNYSGNYIEEIIPSVKIGAKEFLEELFSINKYELILFTTRKPDLVLEWLITNKLDKYFSDITNQKLPAKIYIDDRALKFEGDFSKTLGDIQNFKCYWQK